MAAITEELPEQTLSPGRPAGLTRRDLWPGGRSGRNQRTKNSLAACLQRAHPQDPRETRLWAELLKTVTKGLGADEIAVVAAGLKISHLQEAGLERYVIRLATNFTARRNFLLEPVRGRKPKYGALVRPLSRNHKDKTIEATVPDEAYSWVKEGRTFRVEIWHQLVLNKTRPNAKNKTGDVYAFYDPDFDPPGLLATSVALTAESVRAIYPDRWPVEQIPLSAKQMVAAHRQFYKFAVAAKLGFDCAKANGRHRFELAPAFQHFHRLNARGADRHLFRVGKKFPNLLAQRFDVDGT